MLLITDGLDRTLWKGEKEIDRLHRSTRCLICPMPRCLTAPRAKVKEFGRCCRMSRGGPQQSLPIWPRCRQPLRPAKLGNGGLDAQTEETAVKEHAPCQMLIEDRSKPPAHAEGRKVVLATVVTISRLRLSAASLPSMIGSNDGVGPRRGRGAVIQRHARLDHGSETAPSRYRHICPKRPARGGKITCVRKRPTDDPEIAERVARGRAEKESYALVTRLADGAKVVTRKHSEGLLSLRTPRCPRFAMHCCDENGVVGEDEARLLIHVHTCPCACWSSGRSTLPGSVSWPPAGSRCT